MKDRDIAERALVAAAHDALERGEFTAYYQPKGGNSDETASWASKRSFAGIA